MTGVVVVVVVGVVGTAVTVVVADGVEVGVGDKAMVVGGVERLPMTAWVVVAVVAVEGSRTATLGSL